ncbi:MAG TPA: energy-coupling factor transporter transmembrane protein EcfT, partial [Actinopolymorphaceae bacterium]
RAVASTAVPVLEGALDRSVSLAAAMDSRGYGRVANVPRRTRHGVAALLLGGLLGICVGCYGMLDAGSPSLLGLPALLAGVLAATAGLMLGGRRTQRTRYRPDPWAFPEWLVAGSGLLCAVAAIWASVEGAEGVLVSTVPLEFPTVPVLPALGALVALTPSWLAPPVPEVAT